MSSPAPSQPQPGPTKPSSVAHRGWRYPLLLEKAGWRLRSKAKSHPADFRTGTSNLKLAQERAKEWLDRNADRAIEAKKGGGSLEDLAAVYLSIPKKTKSVVAEANVSRLRVICRKVFGKELSEMTCRQVSPELWEMYQRKMLEAAGHEFDLTTRYRENIPINAAVRAARCLFLPYLLPSYAKKGLDVRRDAGNAVTLPVPYLAPVKANDGDLTKAWATLYEADKQLWLTIGLARFAGLRREEIACGRAGWIEERNGVVSIFLCDRPEEKWWTKTGKAYRAQVINPILAAYLLTIRDTKPSDDMIVPDPSSGDDRERWFERVPQQWLRRQGVKSGKPLHRLRGLYADNVAKLTEDAFAARLAGIRAAQESLGHTTAATTEKHYLTPDALR